MIQFMLFWKRQNYGESEQSNSFQHLLEGKFEYIIQEILGEWTHFVWYCNGEYMTLHICQNPLQKEWILQDIGKKMGCHQRNSRLIENSDNKYFNCMCEQGTTSVRGNKNVYHPGTFFFFFFPAVPVARGNSWVRNQTCTTAATQATAVTMQDL